jgi:hypothetical protein
VSDNSRRDTKGASSVSVSFVAEWFNVRRRLDQVGSNRADGMYRPGRSALRRQFIYTVPECAEHEGSFLSAAQNTFQPLLDGFRATGRSFKGVDHWFTFLSSGSDLFSGSSQSRNR